MRAPSVLPGTVALLLATLAPCAGRPAGAEEPPAPASSVRAHFDEGLKAFDAGEYGRAVEEFQTAYRERPHPDLLINIATCYERLYKASRARELYEQFLAEAAEGSDLRALADKRLKVLRTLPGSLRVDVGQQGAAIELVGKDSERRHESPHTFDELPPGDYQVHVTHPGFRRLDVELTLAPGESAAITEPIRREMEEVTVFSTPDGARVFLDDADTGRTTPWWRSVEVGEHELRLELPDRPPKRLRFKLEVGKRFDANVVLAPPPRSGRTEMVVASGAFGGFAGVALTVAIGGTKVTTGTGIYFPVAAGLGGLGLGLLASWLLTDDNMKVGHSSMIIGSTLWGTFAGVSLSLGLGLTGDEGARSSQQRLMLTSVFGGALGFGAGVLTSVLANPSAGDAAMVNSGALWGVVASGFFAEALSLRSGSHDPTFGWLTLGGNVVGLATGALLARKLEVSRGHVAIIDLAGVVGTLLGYGLGYAAGSDDPDPNSGSICPVGPVNRCVSGARYALGGMAIGLLTAALLTRRFKDDLPAPEALLLHRDGAWKLGLPKVTLGMGMSPAGVDQRALLQLATGEF